MRIRHIGVRRASRAAMSIALQQPRDGRPSPAMLLALDQHPRFAYTVAYMAYDHRRQGSRVPLGFHLVRLAGIEPTTLGFGGQYSIH